MIIIIQLFMRNLKLILLEKFDRDARPLNINWFEKYFIGNAFFIHANILLDSKSLQKQIQNF